MKPLNDIDLAGAVPVGQHDAGLVPRGRGRRLPSTLAAIAERDRLLREAAERFCVGMSDSAAALKLSDAMERYRCTCWRRDAAAENCPLRHLGSLREYLFQILKLRDAPLSAGAVRRALAGERWRRPIREQAKHGK